MKARDIQLPQPIVGFLQSLRANGQTRVFVAKLAHFCGTLARKGGSARLDSRRLNGNYGPACWSRMRRTLESTGLLEIGDSYQAGGQGAKCKSYLLKADLSGPQAGFLQTWTPRRFARAKEQAETIAALSAPQSFVVANLKRLTVAPGWQDDPSLGAAGKDSLARIDAGDFFVSVDKNGRLHHNLANLKKEARPYLRFEGQPLVGVDYSSLHPFLIYSTAPRSERAKLKEWLDGDFYGRLQERAGIKTRKSAKKAFLSALNAEGGKTWVIWKTFAAEFPETAAVILVWKRTDHREAANILQNLESRLVFAEAVAGCMARGIPVLSLHDALFTAPANVEVVRAEMVAASHRLLGIEVGAKAA
jgi:hypothetical protein